jgi:S1-C subfamily serine protease
VSEIPHDDEPTESAADPRAGADVPTVPASSGPANPAPTRPGESRAEVPTAPAPREVTGADPLSPAPVPSFPAPDETPTVAAEAPTLAAPPPPPPELSATAERVSPPSAGPGEPKPDPAHAAPRRRRRDLLTAGIAGGLVGAIVASGVYLAVDDNGASTTTAPSATAVVVRPSDRIARTGDIAQILKADVPAVVAIVDDGGPDSGGAAGTGFVISADGVIVTNNHVVDGAGKIQAVFSDGTTRRAKVLGHNASSDLAVVQVDATGLPTIELGDSDQVQVGDDVVAIGNALALQGGLSVTRGIISGLHREVGTNSGGSLEDVIQTDAAINPGNSGGPLVDAQGRVIGINTAIADPGSAQNVGFAIPISNAKTIIEQLRQGKQPAYLGVTTQNVDQAKAAGRDVSVNDGAYVQTVNPGTPAARAGIQVGDVIVEVEGRTVTSAASLGNVIRLYKPGDKVEITVDRGGATRTFSATLGEAPTS